MALLGGSGGSNLGGSGGSALGGSGGSGGSGSSGTLADQWANPLVASALLISRDGTMDRNAHGSVLAGGGAPPAALSDPDQLRRWDQWVRTVLGVSVLTQNLSYADVGANGFSVSWNDTAAAPELLAELARPDLPFFIAQLPYVQSWAELRDERMAEILAQIDNQFAFIAAATGLHVERKPWTIEWLNLAIQFTVVVEMMFKHAFGCRRPVELSPQVQPIVSTPGHGAYPMGHAAQAFATVVALAGLLGIPRNMTNPTFRQLVLQARRVSVNRVVAGVHFPIDAPAGQALGMALGELVIAAGGIAGATCMARTFTPAGNGGDPANDYLGDGPADVPGTVGSAVTVTALPMLQWLVARAHEEWAP